MFGSGRSGPPVMPVGFPPIKETDEFGRPLRRPRPRLAPHVRWAWLAAAAFAALILALHLLLWRADYPPAFFSTLAALLVGAALWGWRRPGRAAAASARGAVIGSLVGLLVPPVTWVLFALYLRLTSPEPSGSVAWIFDLASATLAPVWAVAVPPAALLGAVLSHIEHSR